METIRPEFEFLNRLQESGETNMFGASPFLACAFSLQKHEARKVLAEWMQWVEEEPSRVDM